MPPRLHSDAFDVIPYEDIQGDWKKLGSGSFGNVYKGSYLGIDVAIKEVLPSNDYDVAKYFEREWRLMKEARHPNVVLYLGLSRAPDPDGRIFIISEFIENGNLRSYIHNKSVPFPWRLRLSFATDIARALAYLHARRCIHRDLKGENLLVTANGRLKITDFGFARIAARNEEESKRLTFCGTDSYMSPEILLGDEFDLPTDIFSLGVIFAEIASRRLADDRHFKRAAPTFAIDEAEVHTSASSGCPPAFVQLAIDCMVVDPAARPTTRQILDRLREIELEVLARPSEADDAHVGSVKFLTGGKRPSMAPRIPSFGVGVGKDIRHNSDKNGNSSDDDSEDELMEAVMGLGTIKLNSDLTQATDGDQHPSEQPLLDNTESSYSDYSTTVIRTHGQQSSASTLPPSLSSIMTIRASPAIAQSPTLAAATPPPARPIPPTPEAESHIEPTAEPSPPAEPEAGAGEGADVTASTLSVETYRTAHSTLDALSIAAATEGGSVISASPSTLVHRFTLIKPGARQRVSGTISPPKGGMVTSASGPGLATSNGIRKERDADPGPAWSPFDFFFSSGLLVSKCDVCTKRIGWKPMLECDDCGLRVHIKCGEMAPRDCGLRPVRPTALQAAAPTPKLKHGNKVSK